MADQWLVEETGSTIVTPERVALAALVGHCAWALWIGLQHPGLGYEADRVANWLYFQSLVTGAPRIAGFWYFPAPKILLVLLLGPLADGPGEMLLTAGVAGCLAASVTWIVASSFGVVAGAATAVLIALDPRWTELVATASADLFVAAGVAAAVCAWNARHERLAATTIFLASLVKPPAALAALPLLLERGRSVSTRCWLVGGATLGVGLTGAGYALLLGSVRTPARFLAAYSDLRADVPSVPEALVRWMVDDIGTELLPWAWPLAAIGLVAVIVHRRARPLRQWLAATVSVAAGYAMLAAATGTLLFPRFLWSLELGAVALSAIAAVLAGRAIAGWSRRPRFARAAAPVAATALLAVICAGLLQSSSGAGGRYVVLFEHGARTAIPWLEQVASNVAPGERVMVPLWFQPAAIWILQRGLPPEAIEAAEVRVATAPPHRPAPEWLLLAPTYVENPETVRWTAQAGASGYRRVRFSELPRMSLLHHDPDRVAHSSPQH